MAATKHLHDLAQALDLRVDKNTETAFGEREGYALFIKPLGQTAQFNVSVSVRRGEDYPIREGIQPFVKGSAVLQDVAVNGSYVIFSTKSAMTGNKNRANAVAAVSEITTFLRTNGFENCCPSCGEVKNTEVFCVQGAVHLLCDGCFQNASVSAETARQSHAEKRENIFLGVVGALLGALIGTACIVLIGQLGYISAISGIVMGVCTLKGYELLAKKMSVKGIILSCVIMLLMIFIGNQLDWAISIAAVYEVDFGTAFQVIQPLLQEGYLDAGVYTQNLVMLYIFSALGAVPMILGTLRQRRTAFTTYRLSAGSAASAPAAVYAGTSDIRPQPEAAQSETPWEK